MSRITEEERKKFHDILDTCLDKLETPKNAMKPHWSKETVQHHRDEIMVESHELNSAVNKTGLNNEDKIKSIKSECKDLVNRSMFIIWNLENLTKIKTLL